MLCGGRKRPQNVKVGQKAPPQFGHDKIWDERKL